VTTIDLSHEQQIALDKIIKWRASNPRGDLQYFTLGGLAGTGKSTLIAYLAQTWPDVAVMAVTGKAAHVLCSKGVDARTVHSRIYYPRQGLAGTRFCRLRHLEGAQSLIVDESSMVDHVLMQDLLSFWLPILFVGDHGQLEPIGTSAGLMKSPNVRLETIHRQAKDNPIIRLAMDFRDGQRPRNGKDAGGRLILTSRADFNRFVSPDFQIICGFNKRRHDVNARVRQVLGTGSALVVPGEKLVGLKNNPNLGIFNGQQVTVLDIVGERRGVIDLEVETDDGQIFLLPCLAAQFGRDAIKNHKDRRVALMDYGYCLTAHKAQGSEWASVLVLEEISPHWDARRWRYTVATRAKERLIYCR
jgi:exodeoxyribonuclease-5